MPSTSNDFDGARDSSAFLLGRMRSNKSGDPTGIYSICSANRQVLEAGMHQAARDGVVVCIESTSNQVNQFGGYTGMMPADFVRFVKGVAAETGFPTGRIMFGGDHLGPHVWQGEPAEQAMANARELVRSCIVAGYTKIHLDTSMRCADDAGGVHEPLPDEIVMARAADLCRIAEEAHASLPTGAAAPVYVIGTEVPLPGGSQANESALAVTREADVERTLDLGRKAFFSAELNSAWQRVVAIVVQPGVEFGDASVHEYDRERARHLCALAEKDGSLVYEAHSTDYQPREKLRQMVEDHFAILKVGPWLTFAFREAVFALAEIEAQWLEGRRGIALSQLPETLENAMLEDATHWKKYYRGDESYLRYARKYSYSDRSRYYWPNPAVQASLSRLMRNLSQTPIPLPLLSQYMPGQYAAVRDGRIANTPLGLIRAKIGEVLGIYAFACGMKVQEA